MAVADRVLLDYIAAHPGAGREQIGRHVAPTASAPTIWRALRRLVDEGQLAVSGRARATGNRVAGVAVVRAHLRTPYHQRRLASYNREFIDRYVPGKVYYLGETERRGCMTPGGRCRSRRRRGRMRAESWNGFSSICPGRRRGWRETPTTFWRPNA